MERLPLCRNNPTGLSETILLVGTNFCVSTKPIKNGVGGIEPLVCEVFDCFPLVNAEGAVVSVSKAQRTDCFFNKGQSYIPLSEALPSGGNAVFYAYAIVSV